MGYFNKIRDSLSLRGNIPGLVVSSLIEGTSWQMFDLIWQPYILSLGGSLPIIGVFVSFWTLFSNGLQFLTGEICDAIGRKPTIQMFYGSSILGFLFSIIARDWIWLIPAIFFFSLADSLGEPSFNPIYAESVDPKKIGIAFSLMGLTWSLPGLYSKIFAGYIGETSGLREAIWIILIGEILSLIVFQFTVKETLKEKRPIDFGAVKRNIMNIFTPKKEFKDIYILSALDRFSWELNNGILIAMIYESFDFSLIQIGVLMTVIMTTIAVALIPSGSLVDRYGSHRLLQASIIIAIISFTGCVFANTYYFFMVLLMFRGLAIALWDPAYYSLIVKTVDESERGTLFGNINGLKGFLVFPAPLIGSYLYGLFGFGMFGASIFVSTLALVMTTRMSKQKT